MKFINLKEDTSFGEIIKQTFKNDIEPLYGDQTVAIDKIISGLDRSCDVCLIKNAPVGFIVYKTELQSEFGLQDAFELKTTFIFRIFQRQGIGKYLFHRAEELARNYKAKHIYATVSNQMGGLLFYMKYLGWGEITNAKSTDNAIDVVALYKELTNESY